MLFFHHESKQWYLILHALPTLNINKYLQVYLDLEAFGWCFWAKLLLYKDPRSLLLTDSIDTALLMLTVGKH